ncbi:MAG TPA: WD40 repeat domain-containing protein, partial [Vicinamibacterales bacterium]|nr:WD40 repeat domain-containing protein [Vicinamibacterales bacterium]
PGGRGVSGHVKVLDRSGKVRELTPYFESARGLAWSASGDEIWFTAGTARSNRALWAVTLAGTQRLIQAVPGSLTLWDIAQDGRVLMTRDEQRRAIRGMAPGERDERDLSWYDNSGVASISRDGRLILLGDRFGIYVRGTDGSDPVKIRSDGLGDDLSPDGKWALVTADGQRTLVLVPTGAGSPKPVPTHDISNYRGARWFPDGTSLLFTGVDKTGATRSFRQSVDGGPPEPLTPPKVIALAVSPKGDMLATTDAKGLALLRVGGASPTFIEGSRPGDRPIAWKDDGGSLWLFRRNELPGTITRLDLRTGLREAFRTLNPPDAAGVYSIIDAQVTPSGHAYAYTYTRLLSQLYLVGGLK